MADAELSTRPDAVQSLWKVMTKFEKPKVAPYIALRNTVGILIPLVIGVASSNPGGGVIAATGALNVSFSDKSDPYLLRAGRMIAATMLGALGVFVGSLAGHEHWMAVAVVTLWAFGAGLMVALDNSAADIGLITLVTLVVFTAHPMPVAEAAYSGLLALSGGVVQTLLAIAFWPVRHDEPERRALAEVYTELSQLASASVSTHHSPPATTVLHDAHKLLDAATPLRSTQAERFLSLLSQAERIRLALLVLTRLRARLGREPESGSDTAVLDRFREFAAMILANIGDALLKGANVTVAPELLQHMIRLIGAFRESHEERSYSTAEALSADARFHMDALAGQLRAAMDLAAYSTPAGRAVFESREAARPWWLRIAGTVATLRANLNLESAACRHAIRLSVCVGLGSIIARNIDFERSYWLPMTVAIILKPDFTTTFSRGALRLAGTFLGLLLATGLSHLVPLNTVVEVIGVGVFAFLLRCFGPANYGIFVVCVSALVVYLFAINGISPSEVVATRALNTALGGILALTIYAAWPTWERRHVSENIARLLDSYRAYFREIREAYLDSANDHQAPLDRSRKAARLARSNFEASVDRFQSEPRATAASIGLLKAMLASSHRLVHAMMALEAGLTRSHPVSPRPAFRAFANHLEMTLHSLSATLRGSALDPAELPDLREDHRAVVNSGDSVTERYALVNVESDRITNSLNTLKEQIFHWREWSS